MTKLKKTRMGFYSAMGIICLLLVVGATAYVQGFSSYEAPQTVMENVTIDTYNRISQTQQADDILGAMASPDVSGNWLRVGGVLHWYKSMDTDSATTTICTMKSPAATSTLVFASVNFDLASSSAVTVRFDQSAVGTSTQQIGSTITVGASASAAILASSSPSINLNDAEVMFAANTDLTVWIQGALSGGNYTLTNGKCKAEWIVIE